MTSRQDTDPGPDLIDIRNTPLSEMQIPVITASSPHDELIRYIRILEARLEIDRIYVFEPDNPASDHLGLVCRSLRQEERVGMLTENMDGIACRELSEALLRREIEGGAVEQDRG